MTPGPPYLDCGHSQFDVRANCLTCMHFTVNTMNQRLYNQSIELSDREADLRDATAALEWIASQKELLFAECSIAEEIILRARTWKDSDDAPI